MPARDRRTNDWHETKYRAVKFECRHWMDTLIISDQKLIFFPSFSIRVGKFRVEKKDLKGDRLVRDRSLTRSFESFRIGSFSGPRDTTSFFRKFAWPSFERKQRTHRGSNLLVDQVSGASRDEKLLYSRSNPGLFIYIAHPIHHNRGEINPPSLIAFSRRKRGIVRFIHECVFLGSTI